MAVEAMAVEATLGGGGDGVGDRGEEKVVERGGGGGDGAGGGDGGGGDDGGDGEGDDN